MVLHVLALHPMMKYIFSDSHPYVAHHKQASQCTTYQVAQLTMKAPRLLPFQLSVAFMHTATNMVVTCRGKIELGQKKMVRTKRTDSQWLLLYAVLITAKPLFAIYIPREFIHLLWHALPLSRQIENFLLCKKLVA